MQFITSGVCDVCREFDVVFQVGWALLRNQILLQVFLCFLGWHPYLVPWVVNSQILMHFHPNLPNPLNFATWPFSTGAWHMTTSTWTWHRPAWSLVPCHQNRCEDLAGGQIQGETFLEQPSMLHGPIQSYPGFS